MRTATTIVSVIVAGVMMLFLGGCDKKSPQKVSAPQKLEDIMERDLRSKVERDYASGPEVDSVEWYVTSRAARPGHIDFDYRANLTVFHGRTSDVYRVSVVSTGGNYPEDYYRITVTPVEM